MSTRVVAIASVLLAASHGALTELFLRRGALRPGGVTGAFTLAFCALAYIWYHQDSTRRGLRRRPFPSAVVFLPSAPPDRVFASTHDGCLRAGTRVRRHRSSSLAHRAAGGVRATESRLERRARQ